MVWFLCVKLYDQEGPKTKIPDDYAGYIHTYLPTISVASENKSNMHEKFVSFLDFANVIIIIRLCKDYKHSRDILINP